MSAASLDKLPSYLKRYCSEQHYERYTPREHASWRYIMRQSRGFFAAHAVPIYLDGLKKTAIPHDRIPKISEMDRALQEFGWGAVPVCGFIPPIAFLDLQAQGVLPIASDMRSIEHIAYTPAPDIVHEAAGHAPIIADKSYRDYLRRYAAMAQKAIMSKEDLNLYEAIRVLSDVKENPDATREQIEQAQLDLARATKKVSYVSEATKVSRMAWWTVEYGLVGSLSDPKIYGAGLLSSVRESQNFLSPKVNKIRLSVDCVNTTYDITEPQPQLFVAESMEHLTVVLQDLEQQLSFRIGGRLGLEEAQKSMTVNSLRLDTGVEISGVLSHFELDHSQSSTSEKKAAFIKFTGPVQLCFEGKELPGQGRLRHNHGFSGPLGPYVGFADKPLGLHTPIELSAKGLQLGKKCQLKTTAGYVIDGVVSHFGYVDSKSFPQRLAYITWSNCTVKNGETLYFDPSWGEFDMVIGDHVVSAFGGPADRDAYGEYEMGGVSTQPGRTSPFSKDEILNFSYYEAIRRHRLTQLDVQAIASDVLHNSVSRGIDWLVFLELIECCHAGLLPQKFLGKLEAKLMQMITTNDPLTSELIQKGISLASQRD